MNGFQGYHNPLERSEYKASAGGTNEDVTIGPVPTGKVWVINWLAFENETTAFDRARVLISGPGNPHYLAEEVGCVADELYWTDNPIYLGETRSITVRFTGTTSSDVLKVYASGFEVSQNGVQNV